MDKAGAAQDQPTVEGKATGAVDPAEEGSISGKFENLAIAGANLSMGALESSQGQPSSSSANGDVRFFGVGILTHTGDVIQGCLIATASAIKFVTLGEEGEEILLLNFDYAGIETLTLAHTSILIDTHGGTQETFSFDQAATALDVADVIQSKSTEAKENIIFMGLPMEKDKGVSQLSAEQRAPWEDAKVSEESQGRQWTSGSRFAGLAPLPAASVQQEQQVQLQGEEESTQPVEGCLHFIIGRDINSDAHTCSCDPIPAYILYFDEGSSLACTRIRGNA
ncbi:unnamed protein product [Vitrella brassicaformis CCMP3155]|uniref:Uncharacterized protein n=1 Tax=Vitrella brassicaformis (strain CCMP3155) TaxID=1169540 RepID=A0A0G4FK85_VITBC|nr:unnamed protein product [Vitrella brassicaformis CCMP3155]|eukprot:CEM13971.1 unnamed protein product [Vitrella brassicaformis CCMP3155]